MIKFIHSLQHDAIKQILITHVSFGLLQQNTDYKFQDDMYVFRQFLQIYWNMQVFYAL